MDRQMLAEADRRDACRSVVRSSPWSDGWNAQSELPEMVWPALPRSGDAARRRALGLLECVVYDSDQQPEGSRVDSFRNLLTTQARVEALAEPFRAHAVVYRLGEVRIGLFAGVPHRFERDRAKIAFDGIDGIAVQHLVSGAAAGSFDGRDVAVDEGAVYAVDMARPAAIEERGAVRWIRVGLGRQTAAEALPGIERLHGVMLDRRAAAPYLSALYGLVPKLHALQAAEASSHVVGLLDALGRCLDGAVASPDPLAEKRGAMLDFIDSHVADRRLTPDFIAASLRISRSVLFSAFRDLGGVERAIVQRRLDRARMILLQPGPRPTVAWLAQVCGFSSPEHFARVFRQRYGTAPSRFAEPGAGPRSGDACRARPGGPDRG